MSDDGQEVLVLSSSDINDSGNIASCGQTTNSNVLTKLLTGGASNSGSTAPSTYILYIPGFRKIEPKPGLELRNDDVEEKETTEKESKPLVGRFLGINATKRGVKTCPVCLNKIGYRAKQCKHCSPSKIKTTRKPRLQTIRPLISKQNEGTMTTSTEVINITTQQQRSASSSVTEHGSDQSLEGAKVDQEEHVERPCVALLEEQQRLRGPPLVSQDQEMPSGDQQGSESLAPQGIQQGLEGIIQQEETQVPQDDAVGQIINQEEKEQDRHIINEVIVSNVTEVATIAEDAVEKANEKTAMQSKTQEVMDPVFISSKATQNQPPTNITSRFSLQDLICGLLAQNQGTTMRGNQEDLMENPNSSTGTSEIAVQTDSRKQHITGKSPDDEGCVELGDSCANVNQEKQTMPSDNSYDANSVALFLGEMAQRNGKKRKISCTSKGTESDPKVVTLMPGVNQKCVILGGNEVKGAKFRKIQPKDIANMQEEVVACEEEKDESGELKGEAQFRIMNGNATRRGVMLCTKCKNTIGCRSKVCKHCKNHVTENLPRQANTRGLKQAVQLSLPKELSLQMFSVRKCKTGPELRCFVQFEDKTEVSPNKRKTCSLKYTCDYPLCITAKELGNGASDYICEHAKACCVPINVLQAKIPRLDSERLKEMPISKDLKDMLQLLHLQCTSKNISLVQHVSSKTLAVVEQLNDNASDPLGTDVISFAHVRFEKVKGQGCFQRQVFCSGRSCMAWNFISNDSPAALMKSCSCVHYAAALWAIASDTALQKEFREYLIDAFVLQAKIGKTSQREISGT